MVKCDPVLLAVKLEGLAVAPTPQPPDEATAMLRLRFADGGVVAFGLTEATLAELCRALIEQSPRAPGTPGRN